MDNFWDGLEKQAVSSHYIAKRVNKRIYDVSTNPVQRFLLNPKNPLSAIFSRQQAKLVERSREAGRRAGMQVNPTASAADARNYYRRGGRGFTNLIQKAAPKGKKLSPEQMMQNQSEAINRSRMDLWDKDPSSLKIMDKELKKYE